MSNGHCNIGKCIRIAQEVRSMPTKDLCAQMGVARQQMHRWKNSDNLKIHTVQSLASIFDMSVNEFISLDAK